ncbi:hypothetical protein ADUPG1_013750 [Aduncisulcus paluster]|uniref:Uncharacterized protein n=1 Tax=Aduncisulcus paluster TaxID=2918883 RepID=A0ABQ5K417_9EUKA|nr:hypothetical protein ADUPG1_013750 [Aduncisulcus paluster]
MSIDQELKQVGLPPLDFDRPNYFTEVVGYDRDPTSEERDRLLPSEAIKKLPPAQDVLVVAAAVKRWNRGEGRTMLELIQAERKKIQHQEKLIHQKQESSQKRSARLKSSRRKIASARAASSSIPNFALDGSGAKRSIEDRVNAFSHWLLQRAADRSKPELACDHSFVPRPPKCIPRPMTTSVRKERFKEVVHALQPPKTSESVHRPSLAYPELVREHNERLQSRRAFGDAFDDTEQIGDLFGYSEEIATLAPTDVNPTPFGGTSQVQDQYDRYERKAKRQKRAATSGGLSQRRTVASSKSSRFSMSMGSSRSPTKNQNKAPKRQSHLRARGIATAQPATRKSSTLTPHSPQRRAQTSGNVHTGQSTRPITAAQRSLILRDYVNTLRATSAPIQRAHDIAERNLRSMDSPVLRRPEFRDMVKATGGKLFAKTPDQSYEMDHRYSRTLSKHPSLGNSSKIHKTSKASYQTTPSTPFSVMHGNDPQTTPRQLDASSPHGESEFPPIVQYTPQNEPQTARASFFSMSGSSSQWFNPSGPLSGRSDLSYASPSMSSSRRGQFHRPKPPRSKSSSIIKRNRKGHHYISASEQAEKRVTFSRDTGTASMSTLPPPHPSSMRETGSKTTSQHQQSTDHQPVSASKPSVLSVTNKLLLAWSPRSPGRFKLVEKEKLGKIQYVGAAKNYRVDYSKTPKDMVCDVKRQVVSESSKFWEKGADVAKELIAEAVRMENE